MSTTEILVSLFGLFLGYWIIHAFVGAGKRPAVAPTNSDAEAMRPWHEVLGVSPQASLEEAQVAYRALVDQYHPDKVAGLGDDLRELAERKSRDINTAYDQALAAIGSRT